MVQRQEAFTTNAEVNRVEAFNPAMADKCALCGNSLGEADPRQFWGGPKDNPSTMLPVHTRCLNKFNIEKAAGRTWPPPPAPPAPPQQPQSFISQPQPPQEPRIIAAKNINFGTFDDMQNFIRDNGQIPKSANVSVGGVQIQHAE